VVAKWLGEKRVTIRGATARFEPAGNSLTERRQSAWIGVSNEPLAWPSEESRLALTDELDAFTDQLIADESPTFTSLDFGVANLLRLNPRGGWNVGTREAVIRRQDLSGRIERVLVGQEEVHVTLDGEDVAGAIVELAGVTPGPTVRVVSGGRQTLSL